MKPAYRAIKSRASKQFILRRAIMLFAGIKSMLLYLPASEPRVILLIRNKFRYDEQLDIKRAAKYITLALPTIRPLLATGQIRNVPLRDSYRYSNNDMS